MTNTQVFQALEDEPWALLDMHDPSPEMEAFALRRLPLLVHVERDWKIDPEYVCPGISIWAKTHTDPAENEQESESDVIDAASAWLHFRPLSFMPPHLISSATRKALQTRDLHTSVLIADCLTMSQWGNDGACGHYPTEDYNPLP